MGRKLNVQKDDVVFLENLRSFIYEVIDGKLIINGRDDFGYYVTPSKNGVENEFVFSKGKAEVEIFQGSFRNFFKEHFVVPCIST